MRRATIRSSTSISTDAEYIRLERLGPLVLAVRSGYGSGPVVLRGSRGRSPLCSCPDVGDGPHMRDISIATEQDPRTHHPAAIVIAHVFGQYPGHGVPVAGREVRLEVFEHLTCGVFESARGLAEIVEPCERVIDIGLVEQFATV